MNTYRWPGSLKGFVVFLLSIPLLFYAGLSSFANTTNAVPFFDSFETYSEFDSIIGTNGWDAQTNSFATITNMAYFYGASTFPLPSQHGGSQSNVVRLLTETQSPLEGVTNLISHDHEVNGVIWIDSMVQFQLWSDEQAPQLTNEPANPVRAAFYVNSLSNLVIYHTAPDTFTNCFTTIPDTSIASGQWTRLTVIMDWSGWNELEHIAFFRVQLDGLPAVTNAMAYNSVSLYSGVGGSNFLCAGYENPTYECATKLSSVTFSGTGYLDDFVVTNNAPTFETRYKIISLASPASGGYVTPEGTYWVTNMADFSITNTYLKHWTNAYIVVSGLGGPQTKPATNIYPLTGITNNWNYTAYFTPVMAPSNVPHYWMETYLGTTNDSVVMNDPDGDTIPTWLEHKLSTHPSDPNDKATSFEIADHYRKNGTNYIKWYSWGIDPALPPFVMRRSLNLQSGWQTVQGVNMAGDGTIVTTRTLTNIWAETGGGSNAAFYRVVATNVYQ